MSFGCALGPCIHALLLKLLTGNDLQGPTGVFHKETVRRAKSPPPTVQALTATMRDLSATLGTRPDFSPLSSQTIRSHLNKSGTLRSRVLSTAPSIPKSSEL